MRRLFLEAKGMSDEDIKWQDKIYKMLVKEGSVTIAEIFLEYAFHGFRQNIDDLNSKKEKLELAFMEPDTESIYLNLDVQRDLWTVLITHEVMHFFLDHEFRAIRVIAKYLHLKPGKLTPDQLANIKNIIYSDPKALVNIAGDTEIAHMVYDEDQEEKLKHIIVSHTSEIGQLQEYGEAINVILSETYPEYKDVPFEDILLSLKQKFYGIPEYEVIEGTLVDDFTFEGDNGVTYDKEQLLGPQGQDENQP